MVRTIRGRRRAPLAWIAFAAALAGACSLVNAPDDAVPPGSGGSGTGGAVQTCETVDDCADDGDPCTVEACTDGLCDATVVDPDDGDACTDDSCDADGSPVNTPIDPNDDNSCTFDLCDPQTGVSNPEALPIFEEDFSTGGANWTLAGPWEIGAAAPSGMSVIAGGAGVWAADPAEDHSSTDDQMLAGVVIGGYAPTTPLVTPTTLHYLESPSFDGTNTQGELVLSYWRYLVSDYQPYMQNTVEVWDGTAWQVIFQVGTEQWFDTGWTHVIHPITQYANTDMKIRFGFGVTDPGAYQDMPSWSIDDVLVADVLQFVDDGDPCTVSLCDPAMGAMNVPLMIDDGDACTEDLCDPVQGERHRDLVTRLHLDFSSPVGSGGAIGPEWAVGPAVGTSGDPATDTTAITDDNRIAGVNIGGNYAPTLHGFYYLTTLPFDGTQVEMGTLELQFQRWLRSDYAPFVINRIEVSTLGGFVPIWESGGAPGIQDMQWMPQTLDLTPYANAGMQLRFGFNVGQSGVATYGGWNLDDIVVRDLSCMGM